MAEAIRVENVTKRFGEAVARDRINISQENCTVSFLLERSSGHDRDKLFQQRAYRVFSIENTIRQRLIAGNRNDTDVRTNEMHLRQDGAAITGSYQSKEGLQIITDVGGFRRDMLRNAVLHLRCLEWNGIRIADYNILQIQFFFCQLCPAGVRVGIRNDAAQRDPEQFLIDDVVFQRNVILKSEQQINLTLVKQPQNGTVRYHL